MILSPNQIAELLSLMDVYTTTFIANTVGTDMLSKADLRVLKNAGVSIKSINNANTSTAQAFKFGMLSQAISDSAAKAMSYDQFKTYIKSGKFFPLSTSEKASLEAIKMKMTSEIRRHSSGMKSDVERKIVRVEKGKAIHSNKVLTAAAKAIEKRQSAAKLSLEIGALTKKWNQDLGRIADYVMHEAFNEGRVAQIERDGSKKAYFDVYPGACKHCIRVYLTGGIGSAPKVFTLAELQRNGSNVGRKQNQWKATIGPVHPWCRCTINEYIEGSVWDPSTKRFVRKKERKVKRDSKVTVTVNGQSTQV